eukprot:1493463-Pyramimonas_sp.AAC.1
MLAKKACRDGVSVTARMRRSGQRGERIPCIQKKNTLPLKAGGRGASTTMSSWGLGPRPRPCRHVSTTEYYMVLHTWCFVTCFAMGVPWIGGGAARHIKIAPPQDFRLA